MAVAGFAGSLTHLFPTLQQEAAEKLDELLTTAAEAAANVTKAQ
ncbi:hypothetical protein ACFOQM_15035 [Paenibacillus sp. GCM10012307]